MLGDVFRDAEPGGQRYKSGPSFSKSIHSSGSHVAVKLP